MDNIVYDKNIFAANLQRLMKRDREKQIDVARLLDVSKSTVSAYCSGAQMPRMDKLELLARHYGVTIAALVESGEPAPAAQGAVVQFPPCPASEIYYGLNRRGQAEYIRYGEYLSGQPEFRASSSATSCPPPRATPAPSRARTTSRSSVPWTRRSLPTSA